MQRLSSEELNPGQSGLMKSGLALLNGRLFTPHEGSRNALCFSLTRLYALIKMGLAKLANASSHRLLPGMNRGTWLYKGYKPSAATLNPGWFRKKLPSEPEQHGYQI